MLALLLVVSTQVWMVPAPAGDTLRFIKEPELSVQARSRINVFSFYQGGLLDWPGFVCGDPCGPNTFPALRDAVPGGAFRWLQDQGIQLAMEAPAVKPGNCTADLVGGRVLDASLNALDNVVSTGAHLDHISIDESFAASIASPDYPRGQNDFPPCGLTGEDVAQLLKLYIDGIHAKYPAVQVGFIEPYPYFSVDILMSNLLELEHAGIPIPYFHLDFDLRAARNGHRDVNADLRRIRAFCAARDIPFGVIIIGDDSPNDHGYAAAAWAQLRVIAAAVGVTEHTLFDSWSIDTSDPAQSRSMPHMVPETDPDTHLGEMLAMLTYLDIP
jgi:hypothetical protein